MFYLFLSSLFLEFSLCFSINRSGCWLFIDWLLLHLFMFAYAYVSACVYLRLYECECECFFLSLSHMRKFMTFTIHVRICCDGFAFHTISNLVCVNNNDNAIRTLYWWISHSSPGKWQTIDSVFMLFGLQFIITLLFVSLCLVSI